MIILPCSLSPAACIMQCYMLGVFFLHHLVYVQQLNRMSLCILLHPERQIYYCFVLHSLSRSSEFLSSEWLRIPVIHCFSLFSHFCPLPHFFAQLWEQMDCKYDHLISSIVSPFPAFLTFRLFPHLLINLFLSSPLAVFLQKHHFVQFSRHFPSCQLKFCSGLNWLAVASWWKGLDLKSLLMYQLCMFCYRNHQKSKVLVNV